MVGINKYLLFSILMFFLSCDLFAQESKSYDDNYSHICILKVIDVKSSVWKNESNSVYKKRTLTVNFDVKEELKGKVKLKKEAKAIDLVQYQSTSNYILGGGPPTIWSSYSIKKDTELIIFSNSKDNSLKSIVENVQVINLSSDNDVNVEDIKFSLKNKKEAIDKQVDAFFSYLKKGKKKRGPYIVDYLYSLLEKDEKKLKGRDELFSFFSNRKNLKLNVDARSRLIWKLNQDVLFKDDVDKKMVKLFLANCNNGLLGKWKVGDKVKKLDAVALRIIADNISTILKLKKNQAVFLELVDLDTIKLLGKKMKSVLEEKIISEQDQKIVLKFVEFLGATLETSKKKKVKKEK